MRRNVIVPLLFGIIGVAILVSLGVWQVQRLQWKNRILSDIETRIAAEPVTIPDAPDPESDKYLPVVVEGDFTGERIRVLVSLKQVGAGYRYISVMETEAGRILVDRGFARTDAEGGPEASREVRITGNLHWPDEVDGYTPDPDLEAGIWFARDVPRMAAHLETRPVLVIASKTSETDPFATPLRLDSAGIPNDHLEYAITWFSLAAIWAGMTGFFLWRTRRPAEGKKT